ncbi:hypothetical protein BXZ70DRAFT_884990 [Cristinia sonorae]|uniref:Uncharacterized protein n=1 Tax=Cristinia sonorae TaxID=1940300 RepID=A0A8K0V120_9AGAR|nr:hypothetical protein BXZ70DRAFT_884990 [Cristinia sonorae]
MDDRDERQQLDELRALLKRAEKTPAKTAAVRKEALKRLIEVVHSPYTSLKTLAASNFRLFIKDFPELEDDAINAVYDLCEDSVAKVRIDGYYAIISVSKEQKKWVKRNADVLVQLLQSDEPEEVVVVKKALIEHLDMDPVVTLGVLCDQIAPLSQDWDEEDQVTRDRLRSLVLAFLTGEAHRAITERHAHTPGSPAEEVLVTGILKGIPKLPHTDVDLAVKELLLSLSSFSQYSSRGAELLEVVLEAAKSSLKAEVASGVSNPPVPNTSYFLGLASFISVEKRVAKPDILLRFYCTSVVSRVILMRLPEVAKASILSGIADSLIACDEITRSGDFSKEEMTKLRKQVVDTCVVLLPCFASITSSGKRPWKSCRVLLQECSQVCSIFLSLSASHLGVRHSERHRVGQSHRHWWRV